MCDAYSTGGYPLSGGSPPIPQNNLGAFSGFEQGLAAALAIGHTALPRGGSGPGSDSGTSSNACCPTGEPLNRVEALQKLPPSLAASAANTAGDIAYFESAKEPIATQVAGANTEQDYPVCRTEPHAGRLAAMQQQQRLNAAGGVKGDLGVSQGDENGCPFPCAAGDASVGSVSGAAGTRQVTDMVEVPSSEHVAEIVGRQGCKIKALRAKTNTYIKTPVRGEEPHFVITGRPADVLAAKAEIEQAADHFTQIRASRRHSQGGQTMPGHMIAYVRVPYRVVGLVVGPKGATIKRIQQETHTYIVTPSRDKEPIFEVTGLPTNVGRARVMIEEHIVQRTGMHAANGNGGADSTNMGPNQALGDASPPQYDCNDNVQHQFQQFQHRMQMIDSEQRGGVEHPIGSWPLTQSNSTSAGGSPGLGHNANFELQQQQQQQIHHQQQQQQCALAPAANVTSGSYAQWSNAGDIGYGANALSYASAAAGQNQQATQQHPTGALAQRQPSADSRDEGIGASPPSQHNVFHPTDTSSVWAGVGAHLNYTGATSLSHLRLPSTLGMGMGMDCAGTAAGYGNGHLAPSHLIGSLWSDVENPVDSPAVCGVQAH